MQMVSGRIGASVNARLNRVAETVLADLFSADELELIRAQFARAGRPPVVLRPPEKRQPTTEDKLLVFTGATGGLGAGSMLARFLPGSARSARVRASARACSRWPRSRSSGSARAGGCNAPASTPRTSST